MEVVSLAQLRRRSETFAVKVKTAFQARGLGSTRAAAKVTGIGHATLHRMLQGVIPSITTVKQWAAALGEPEGPWLVWAYGSEGESLDESSSTVYGDAPPSQETPARTPYETPRTNPVPAAVLNAIEAASGREEKITLAFHYLLRPELDLRLGSDAMLRTPIESQLALIRLWERLTGQQLLPPEVA